MAIRKYIEPGLDPTGVVCLTKADLLQMFQAAQPDTDIGFVIISALPPSVATYPVLERFLWLCTANGTLYRHNGASWVAVISQATVSPGSITAAMLDVGTGTAYQVLAVAHDLSAITFQSIANVIGAGLTGTTTGTSSFLQLDGSVAKWGPINFSLIADGAIPFAKLAPTSLAANYLYVADGLGGWTAVELPSGGTGLTTGSVQRTHLDAPNTGTAGQVLTVPSSGAGFEWTTPSTVTTIPAAVLTFTPTGWISGLTSGRGGMLIGQTGVTYKVTPWVIQADPTSMILTLSGGDVGLDAGTYLIEFNGRVRCMYDEGWAAEVGLYVGGVLQNAVFTDLGGGHFFTNETVKGLITVASASSIAVQFKVIKGGSTGTRAVLGWKHADVTSTYPVAQLSILKVA